MIIADILMRMIRRLLDNERKKILKLWSRSLPTGEYLNDRWKRAENLGFGDCASVYDSTLVLGDVRVGAGTWIGPFVVLDGSGVLEIGANCSISAGVQIYTHNTVGWASSGGVEPIERARTCIGSNVYIGPNSVIAMGVHIGDGAVIGTNSFVNKDIPAGCRAWGNPCQIQSNQSDIRHL